MAGPYDAAVAVAFKLVKAKGRTDGKLTRPGGNTPDPATPWRPSEDPDLVIGEGISIVVLDAAVAKVDGLTEGSSAVGFLAAGSGIIPKLGDLLETKGARYSILKADELAPGDTTILYILHLKG
jgi:hypothetical protein